MYQESLNVCKRSGREVCRRKQNIYIYIDFSRFVVTAKIRHYVVQQETSQDHKDEKNTSYFVFIYSYDLLPILLNRSVIIVL